MTQFLYVGSQHPTIRENDMRLSPRWFADRIGRPIVTVEHDRPFRSAWWPRSGMVGEAAPVFTRNRPWLDFEHPAGGSTRWGFVGVTRDVYGSPLPFAVVKAFLTATDEKTDQVLSDGNGAFTITTPYLGMGHYLVAYKAGAPDVEGTTVNTLLPY